MASGTVYLDVDDEITSAAQRIRGSVATKVALVVPAGSRIATSRMNFRLLSREAIVNNRRLSIVANDPATRALAASAGLPVYANVAEYEASLAAPTATPDGDGSGGAAAVAIVPTAEPAADEGAATEPVPRPATGRGSRRRPKAPPVTDETQLVMLPDAPTASAAEGPATAAGATSVARAPVAPPEPSGGTGLARLPVIRSRPNFRVRAPLAIAGALIALAVVVAGVAAYVFLPSAEIRITPRQQAIGPISLVVVADPDATAPDADVDPPVVPATRLSVPISVSDTFTTAGRRVEETAAEGVVTFTNFDITSSNTIAAGSIVSTSNGVRFRTASSVTVPRARRIGAQIITSEEDVRVVAVKKGTTGNVEPNAITVIPAAEDPVALTVRNKSATSGGTREEFAQIDQDDIEEAIASLSAKLPDAFATAIASGEGVPAGAEVFDETAVLGEPTATVDPATLLGQEVETFELELTATGTVIAVDASPVEDIAEARLLSNVGSDHRLVEGSIQYERGDPTVENAEVSFPITASAARVALLDPAELLGMIKGQTVEGARAILAEFGDVEVSTWPEWVSAIPGIDSRVSLEIVGQGDAAPPDPSPSGSGS
ncbi:MAG TPA: hypothetical protein VFO73_09625 [Candidatus Limnocylindrales bacterium]|nr:hypothetical protein [Candidatus Limnocylindrales bacterium]